MEKQVPRQLHSFRAGNCAVLIVQDDYEMASNVADQLEKAGIAPVIKADTVREALWCISECKPHVMVLDINIPLTDRDRFSREFGGFEVARRAAETGFDMWRVIVFSGSDAKEELEPLGVEFF